MTARRLLFSLAALAVGALVALPVARYVLPSAPAEVGRTGSLSGPAPAAQPIAPEPVELGADVDNVVATAAPDWAAFNRQTTAVASQVKPAVVFVQVAMGSAARSSEAGSGIIISEDGYVLTSAHVVERTGRVSVLLPDKREFDAEVVGRDPTTDVAVLRLLEVGVDDARPLPVARLGDSNRVEVGEWVLAVGSPFRLVSTVTSGIVSATGRQVGIIRDEFSIEDFIQTDAAINPGSSGGAIANLRGEVVALVTAIATEGGGYEGYGFAVPMNLARRVAEDLIAYGETRRGYLGVEIRPVTAADAREIGMERIRGVLVVATVQGGAASEAGLRAGDVLLEVGGRTVDEPNQFQSRLAQSRPGERVGLTIWRGGEERAFETTLIGREAPAFEEWFATRDEPPVPVPSTSPERNSTPDGGAETSWGVRFRDLSPAERREFRVSAGALVESVLDGGAAYVDGLPSGIVVTEIEGRPIASAEDATTALSRQARRDEPALLRVRRADGRIAFYDLAAPFVN